MAYHDPAPRSADGSPEPSPYPAAQSPAAAADLDGVDRRDRLGVHIMWESLLLLGVVGAVFFSYRLDTGLLTSAGSRDELAAAALPLLLTAVAVAVSLRVGAVNLAVGAQAVVAGVMFAENADRGLAVAMAIGMGAAVTVGAVVAALTLMLRAPGWLASGVTATAVLLWIYDSVDVSTMSAQPLSPHSTSGSLLWLAGAAGLAVVGAAIWATPSWRTRLGACRDRAAVGTGRHRGAIVLTALALLFSAATAGFAGIWLMWLNADVSMTGARLDPLLLTAFGFAAALVGGVNAHGRRGGIAGVALATALLALVLNVTAHLQWQVNPVWILLAAIGVGAVVSSLVDALSAAPAPPPHSETDTDDDTAQFPAREDPRPWHDDPGDIDPFRRNVGYDDLGHR